MGVFKVISTVLGVGSAGLAVADRMAGPPRPSAASPEPIRVDLDASFPSQSDSAAALSAHLGRARERDRVAAAD